MKKISVLIDTAQSPFSEMLISVLNNIGIEANGLCRPNNNLSQDSLGKLMRWGVESLTSKSQIIHYLGGNLPFPFYALPKLVGKKVIIHWIGTDSLNASSHNVSRISSLGVRLANLHLAQAQHLADELSTIGIKAKVIPLVPSSPAPAHMPLGTNICVYLPERDPKLYGADATFELVRKMPDVNFLIIANNGKYAPALSNVTYFSWMSQQDMESIWTLTKVLLRLTSHDGMPITIMEALLRGRYVVWSYAFPFCLQAKSIDEAEKALRTALAQTELNTKGRDYALTQFNPIKMAKQLKQEYERLLI